MKTKVSLAFLREIIIINNINNFVTSNKVIILIIYVFLVKSEDERRLWTCERALRVHSPGCDRQGTRPTTIYFNRLETVSLTKFLSVQDNVAEIRKLTVAKYNTFL